MGDKVDEKKITQGLASFPVFLTKIPLYCKWIVDGSYTERQSSIHREALGDPDNLIGEEIFILRFIFFFFYIFAFLN